MLSIHQTPSGIDLPFLRLFAHNATDIAYSGLDFTAQALRHNLNNPSKELSDSFREAYGGTLKPHHSFVVKPLFSAAMSATPYRKNFLQKLGDDESKVISAMEKEVAALERVVAILKTFQARKDAQWK